MTSTKAEAAYRALRRAIVTLAIEGGEPLDEAVLVERFGIGSTPLRETLKQLALEQSVVAPPHRTTYVRSFSLAEPPSTPSSRHPEPVPGRSDQSAQLRLAQALAPGTSQAGSDGSPIASRRSYRGIPHWSAPARGGGDASARLAFTVSRYPGFRDRGRCRAK